MSSRKLLIVTFLLVVSVSTAIFIVWRSKRSIQSESQNVVLSDRETKLVVASAYAPQSSFPDDAFYIFNDGSEIDFLQGRQFFGSQDKTGIDKEVFVAHQNELDDFLYIGQLNPDREQYLTAQGVSLQNPTRKWHVEIVEAGAVNGEMRVSVIACVGNDVEENGGIRLGIEAQVSEIWKLDTVGAMPTLLDRTTSWFNGVSTNAESPISHSPPPTVPFGPPADPNEMGNP